MSFGLKSLPSDVESDWVEAPLSQVFEVLFDEWAIRVEGISDGVVRKFLKDWINSMKHSDPIVLISEDIIVRVNCIGSKSDEEKGQSNYCYFDHSRYNYDYSQY